MAGSGGSTTRTGAADGDDARARLNHWAIALLGIVTIVAYGSWYYAFGVLFDPIRLDTGWNEAQLALSFSIGTVLMGVASIAGGRLLDRLGSRFVLTAAGLGGGGALVATSFADHIVWFIVCAAVGMVFLGGFAFYHVTMATAVRIHPDDAGRAIAVLTIWGAFASAIYLPLAAYLVERFEWRDTVRIMAAAIVVVLVGAAFLLPGAPETDPADPSEPDAPDSGAEPRPPLLRVITATIATPERRAFTAAVALGGLAMSTVLVYQVPTMTAAGLPLGTAATMAGLRGFAQTFGRVPLSPLVRWLGSGRALVLAFGAMTVGGGLLAFSGNVPTALAFAAVTGFGIGAFSPLQGIKAEELYDRETLGATMGLYGTFLMVAGAAGPAIAGVLADTTGDRRLVSIIVVVAAFGATLSAARIGDRTT
ncbi:MAG: MFS transporter [Actinomycetota bacterium]